MKHRKPECEVCHMKFKNDRELDCHIDVHTPYWVRGKKIRLSGADQIRLMLKHWSGGWKQVIKTSQKHKNFTDVEKAKRLEQFEKDNKIDFIVNGDRVESYRSLL